MTRTLPLILFAFWSLAADSPTAPDNRPIPDGAQIKGRMVDSFRKAEDALENYSCIVHDRGDELNADGSLKRRRTSVKEQFFVNRIEIEHTLERDGKPLSPSDARKEQERVDKEVRKYSDKKEAEKAHSREEKEADIFLRALALRNGKRRVADGRSLLFYDLAGDPTFHPRKLEERFAAALTGKVAIDEESGTPVDMRFSTVQDVKIGAGVFANLHKGFWLHLTQQRQPDGVWITKEVEGSGEARAALFIHARFRFGETLEKCHRYSVNSQDKIADPHP